MIKINFDLESYEEGIDFCKCNIIKHYSSQDLSFLDDIILRRLGAPPNTPPPDEAPT